MLKRVLGVLLTALLVSLLAAVPAAATEAEPTDPAAAATAAEAGEEAGPELSAICAEEAISSEFCPDDYQEPSFFQWFESVLLIVGVIMAVGLLVIYLYFQPRFAQERKARRNR